MTVPLMFLLKRYSSVFQIISWNWKHLINRKMQAKKVFWHVVIYATLCVCFSSKSKAANVFPKNILKSKHVINQFKQWRNCFCRVIAVVIVKNYLCNVLCKFSIKIESMWRRKIKEQTPLLTLPYCARTVRSSNRRWFLKHFAIFACAGVSFLSFFKKRH